MPLALDESSEPAPDLAVVLGGPRDYRNTHPRGAVLVVEVADATLAFDREQKKHVYARTGIPEYWIVNLVEHQLEVHRGPDWEDYRHHAILRPGESLLPIAASEGTIPVSELMP
jgi:Uma2 family endonuclease